MKDCTSLLRQFEFSAKENIKTRGFKKDPVGDRDAEVADGILQKYKGRLLVLSSDKCARQCRFCFRKNRLIKKASPEALRKIMEKDKSIKEVILSGGDPMILKKSELQKFFDAIPAHIRIRIHTRIVNFNPLFKKLGSRLIFVSHINHPSELNEKTEKTFGKLAKCGATLLNQSVLLKGVNDNAKILAELSEKLFSQRVLPYYLHQLDKAQGTAHFEVPIKEAKRIVKELKEMLPGYLVPRFVKEVKGKKSKVWV
ncbi:MAG: KamA family radical SAM protein [Fibromonadales bacterium]|nr:KamA family radical SAM protein [Fibromonadales bacterium]